LTNVLDLALQAAVIVFMIGTLGGVGLGLAARDVGAPLKHVPFVALSLFLCWVVSPAIAVLLLHIVPIAPGYATGLLLLALAPCAPFAPAMAQIARGDAAYMAAFVVLSAASTVVMMPIATPLLVAGLSPDPVAIARPLVLFVLLPLLIGMAVRARSPAAADAVRPFIAVTTSFVGGALLVLTGVLHAGSVLHAVGSFAIAAQVLYVAAVTAAAYLLGSGLAHEQRTVLTLGLCTRNLGAALAPLAAIDHDPRAMVMIVIAVPVTLGISLAAARWLARREHARLSPPRKRSAVHTPAGSA
jgi:bile acid:Na+ symporter, BASS family